MTPSAGRCLTWLLLACVTLGAASCGSRVAGAARPAGAAPSASTPSSAGGAATTRTRATRPRQRAGTTVIAGVVQVDPGCPVDPVYHACRPHPLGHVVVRAISGTAVLASARTQADGGYVLRLRPGSYVLVVQITGAFPQCPRMPVWIGSGTSRRANITCDSGMAPTLSRQFST